MNKKKCSYIDSNIVKNKKIVDFNYVTMECILTYRMKIRTFDVYQKDPPDACRCKFLWVKH